MFLFPWLDWGDDISDFEKNRFFWVMGDFGVFPAPGQADILQQRHFRRWAENFPKVYEKNFLKNF